MSWHHGDYIDLLSAIGGAASAAFAAYATWLAKTSTELSRAAVSETARQGKIAILTAELVRLSERANAVVGEKSKIKEGHRFLLEMITAVMFAKDAIETSNLHEDDKASLSSLFIRHIHPAVYLEVCYAQALMRDYDAKRNKGLIKEYREAQQFLKIDSPSVIPDPI
ncbi:hypothetical protein [Pantoea agglomerans]|uniref:hypothetical protein n=1 Tax=Enterobacter agglomerans TaxID=549 RepID=UPI001559DD3A|nr:hypothetical protein [Pantoea agglomerans]NQS80594.1 hypothetical protein [Pantoea agglomerans]